MWYALKFYCDHEAIQRKETSHIAEESYKKQFSWSPSTFPDRIKGIEQSYNVRWWRNIESYRCRGWCWRKFILLVWHGERWH